jgi:hypothetical protein
MGDWSVTHGCTQPGAGGTSLALVADPDKRGVGEPVLLIQTAPTADVL